MSDFSTISRHAATVLAGQLAVMAFGVTDTIVAGRHSEASLAALSVGSAIFVSVFVALMGMLQALLPIWAKQRGARNASGLGHSFRQSLYVCLAASAIGIAILLSPGALLQWTDVPPALREEVQRYLAILALALPPALLFRLYSTLNQALGKPQLVMWLQVGGLFIKLPLSIWFTFGGAGLPSYGVAGCAWATLAVNCSMMVVAIWLVRTQDIYRSLQIWQRMERPHWPTLLGFTRLGVAAALSIMVEVTSFTLMALFIARQGTAAAAAHQIASNLAAVMYMVPLALAIATSASAGYWLGAGQDKRARTVVLLGIKLTSLSSITLSAIVIIAKDAIISLYSSSAPVIALASGLLVLVAFYHVADALQTLCIFVLRCYGITAAPLAVYCILLWGAGLGGGYMLAYTGLGSLSPMATPASFWGASALALAATAVLFVAMTWQAIGRHAFGHRAIGSQER